MSINSDFRFLAKKDIKHRKLSFIPDIWYNKFKVIVIYDKDKKPVTGIVLKEEMCSIDPDADMRIYLWVANLDLGQEVLEPYLAKAVEAVRQEMIIKGKTKVWGAVPKYSIHLTTFLDKVAKAFKCEKVDGEEQTNSFDEGDRQANNFNGLIYYIGDRDAVADFVKGN